MHTNDVAALLVQTKRLCDMAVTQIINATADTDTTTHLSCLCLSTTNAATAREHRPHCL